MPAVRYGVNRLRASRDVQDLLLLALEAGGSALYRRAVRLGLWLPVLQVVFGVVENLSALGAILVHYAGVTWHDGRVVEQVKQATTVLGQDDLLLGTLDGGGELGGIRLFQLLASL